MSSERIENLGYILAGIISSHAEDFGFVEERTCHLDEGHCSNCDEPFRTIDYDEHRILPNYCPNCGARVKEKK